MISSGAVQTYVAQGQNQAAFNIVPETMIDLWLATTFFAAGSSWWLVKRAAIECNQPDWWDYGAVAAGLVAFVPALLINLSASWPGDRPVLAALTRAAYLGVGVAFGAWFWGLWIETETDWLTTPDRLARPAMRLRGQQTVEGSND